MEKKQEGERKKAIRKIWRRNRGVLSERRR
jgi:hypothetical protein